MYSLLFRKNTRSNDWQFEKSCYVKYLELKRLPIRAYLKKPSVYATYIIYTYYILTYFDISHNAKWA